MPAASSLVKTPQDLAGKTIGYSTNGSSTHAGILALQKYYKVEFQLAAGRRQRRRDYDRGDERTGRCRMGGRRRSASPKLEAGKIRLIREIRRRSRIRQTDQPRAHRQCRCAQGAPRRRHAFHARLSGVAFVDLFDAGRAPRPTRTSPNLPAAHGAASTLKEFLPLSAVNPDRVSGIDEVMADAISFKFIAAAVEQGATHFELIQARAATLMRRCQLRAMISRSPRRTSGASRHATRLCAVMGSKAAVGGSGECRRRRGTARVIRPAARDDRRPRAGGRRPRQPAAEALSAAPPACHSATMSLLSSAR